MSTAQIPEQRTPEQTVTPEPDSRLDQLAAEYAALKPLVDDYVSRLNAIKDGLKVELTAAAPGAEKILLTSSYLDRPLRLSARREWRIDSKRLKTEDPETWVRYARQFTTWRLESAR